MIFGDDNINELRIMTRVGQPGTRHRDIADWVKIY